MEHHVTHLGCALARRGTDVMVCIETPVDPTSMYVRELRAAGVSVRGPPRWSIGVAAKMRKKKHLRALLSNLVAVALRLFALTLKACSALLPRGARWRASRSAQAISFVPSNDFVRLFTYLNLLWYNLRKPVDLVHVHGFRLEMDWVLQWAQSLSLPTIYTEHSTVSDWVTRDHASRCSGLARTNIITSVARRSSACLKDIANLPCNVEVVRHIVPAPAACPSAIPESPDNVLMMSVANMRHEKGLDCLLHAMADVCCLQANVRLELVGDGVQRESLEQLTDRLRLGAKVTYRGRLHRDAIYATIQRADVVIFSSLTEGMPVTLIESMACGKAIVATNVGGIPELIENGKTGLLVSPQDVGGLARAIHSLAADPAYRKRLGAAATERYLRGGFDEKTVLAEMIAIYRRAVAAVANERSFHR